MHFVIVMKSVDGWDNPYKYINFKSPLLLHGCTFIVHKLYKLFLIKVENLKPSPIWHINGFMAC